MCIEGRTGTEEGDVGCVSEHYQRERVTWCSVVSCCERLGGPKVVPHRIQVEEERLACHRKRRHWRCCHSST